MCTAMGQARGDLSRGLSYINLYVRGDVLVDIDSLSDRLAVINVGCHEQDRSIAHKKFNTTD